METKTAVLLMIMVASVNSVSNKDGKVAGGPTPPSPNSGKPSEATRDENKKGVVVAASPTPHTAVPGNSSDTAAKTANNTSQTVHNKNSDGESKPGDNVDKIEGMSDSLADFVLSKILALANSNNSETGKAHSPGVSNNSNSNITTNNSSTSTNITTSAVARVIPQRYEVGKLLKANNEQGKTNPENAGPISSSKSKTQNVPAECRVPVDLRNYCLVDADVVAYFGGDTTVKGLSTPLFKMDIVQRLLACPRGEWCLPNTLETFREMEAKFIQGPLCDEGIWECIFEIMVKREDCTDPEFMFVVDAMDMLCDLFKNPAEAISEEMCFAHALAALHVTYADFLANNMSSLPPAPEPVCEGHKFRMIKTYLCADSRCDDLFQSRLAMERFHRWAWFMPDVGKTVDKCDVTDVCGSLKEPTLMTTTQTSVTKTWSGMTTTSKNMWPPHSVQDRPTVFRGHGDSSAIEDNDRLSKEDESLMVALSVATAVGLLFMVLGLIFWRRNRRRNLYYYRTVSDGYDKDPSDEAHLLSRSSD